jgi:hypothetical protein
MREEEGEHRSNATAATAAAVRPTAELSRDLRGPLPFGERACCCPAMAAVRVILPSTATRDHPVDLLLCAHHYRKASAELSKAGAHIFDASGILLNSSDRIARD